jgi:hypothetical protein
MIINAKDFSIDENAFEYYLFHIKKNLNMTNNNYFYIFIIQKHLNIDMVDANQVSLND